MIDYKLAEINDINLLTYVNLAQAYEAEFSNLTKKMPNNLGVFEPHTMPLEPYFGYLLFHNNLPIGFCIIESCADFKNIAEFYIIPAMRKSGCGKTLAFKIFNIHRSTWHVKQIAGAENARNFWRKVINEYTQGQYLESIVEDSMWGTVTMQSFKTNSLKSE